MRLQILSQFVSTLTATHLGSAFSGLEHRYHCSFNAAYIMSGEDQSPSTQQPPPDGAIDLPPDTNNAQETTLVEIENPKFESDVDHKLAPPPESAGVFGLGEARIRKPEVVGVNPAGVLVLDVEVVKPTEEEPGTEGQNVQEMGGELVFKIMICLLVTLRTGTYLYLALEKNLILSLENFNFNKL